MPLCTSLVCEVSRTNSREVFKILLPWRWFLDEDKRLHNFVAFRGTRVIRTLCWYSRLNVNRRTDLFRVIFDHIENVGALKACLGHEKDLENFQKMLSLLDKFRSCLVSEKFTIMM